MNKFLILIAALLGISQLSIAQTERGSQTLGLNLSYSGTSYSDNTFNNSNFANSYSKVKNTSFALGPLYSYFIADRVDLRTSFSLRSFTASTKSPNFSIAESGNHNKD